MRRINFGQKLLDNRWKASDQLIQLKGLVEFDERYRYWIGLKDEIKTEERDKQLKKLANRVKLLRTLIKKHGSADLPGVEEVLQQDREIFLICRGKSPVEIIENLKQMTIRKKLAVDKTFYEVKKREKELYNIQNEISQSKLKMTQDEEIVRNKEIDEREQYSAALEYATSQKDVCRITLDNYNKLLGILKNDAQYFDDLLNMLKEDALIQSNALVRMMTLGQMLSEDFSWVKNEAKKLAITFNAATKGTRLDIKTIGNEIKNLEKFNSYLRDYAAHNYPLFQEEKKPPVKSEEEVQLRSMLSDLEDFIWEWKTNLNAEEETDFFPKLLRKTRMMDVLRGRMTSIRMQKDYQEEMCTKLELVMAELDNCIDDDVRKDLSEIFKIDKEINDIAEEMQNLKNQEDKINEEMDFYKNKIYQFKRMLSHVFIGPPFIGEHVHEGSDIEGDIEAVNRLRYENPDFQIFSDSEQNSVQENTMESIARSYLDPNKTFDMKEDFNYESSITVEDDPIQLLDNIMMQMKTVNESLGPEIMGREPTEDELMELGDFYAQVQEDADAVIEECMEKERIFYKRFKPRTDEFRKKTCSNKTRMEVKMESQIIVFENEGPVQGMIVNKGALHPPGVIRGMYVPETDEEEDEEDEKKEEGAEVKDDEEEEEVEVVDQPSSSEEEEEIDSDLDPNVPKPHICF